MATTTTTAIVDPNSFDGSLHQSLAILLNQKQVENPGWMTAAAISKSLRNDYGLGLHWRVVETVLSDNPQYTSRRKRKRQWQFAILNAGQQLLGAVQSSILFVDPTQAFKATLSLHDFFSQLKGTVRVCDAYLDNKTLEHLHALDKGVAVRLLTKKAKDPTGTLQRLVAAWKAEGRNLEIRFDGSAPLHDRYIIDDSSMVILGTSLNSFGKSQCFIIRTGPDLRASMIPVFADLWGSATPWP